MNKAEVVFEKLAENLRFFKGTLEAERARTGGKKYPFLRFRSKDYYKNVALPNLGTEMAAMAPGAALATMGVLKDRKGAALAGLAALYAGIIGSGIASVKRDQKWLEEHGVENN